MSVTTSSSHIELIEQQVEAYCARNLEKFVSFYSKDIQIFKLPQMNCIVSNHEELKNVYSKRFENKEFELTIVNRISNGDYVIDHEKFMDKGTTKEIVVIYWIQNNLISKVWIA